MSPVSGLAVRPDAPALADRAAVWAGTYVHVPFCTRVCPYCDFAVVEGQDHLVDRYVAALEVEIGKEPAWRRLDAVFVGGGTPSKLSAGQLHRIVEALRSRFGLASDAELTLEANPEDWSASFALELVDIGFTRVSFGAQSFDPRVLERLGRRHSADQIDQAVHAARVAGFRSINVDLIFGTPGESLSEWFLSVDRALRLPIDHLSTYALTVERGTPLSRQVAAGAPAPDPDDQAEKYEAAAELAEAAGLVRYEVSNYAAPGHHCRYNLTTWAQGEYLAFGAGAHGHRDGVRSWNVRRLDGYLTRVLSGVSPRQGSERLEGREREIERLMLGLRRTAGVEAGPAGDAFLASDAGRRLAKAGVLTRQAGRLRVIRPLLTDEVSRSVLALSLQEC
jgi:oxygen-independent coproporphyrinogen-3 oxidase